MANQAKKILLSDNRTNDLATYNDEILLSLLSDLAVDDDLLGTSYDGDDLDQLISDLQDNPPDGFQSFDEDSLETETVCPKCGYEF